MKHTINDQTLTIAQIKNFKFLIKEYQLVKKKKHQQFKFVSDFYKFHNLKDVYPK